METGSEGSVEASSTNNGIDFVTSAISYHQAVRSDLINLLRHYLSVVRNERLKISLSRSESV